MHLKYLKYVLIHKWFVLLACWRRGLIWQGIVHDWSKFLPSEWIAYARFFYSVVPLKDRDALRQKYFELFGSYPWKSVAEVKDDFNRAWLLHQHRNKHHWQHWVLREDSGRVYALKMPLRYVLEMLADWEGAGRAITGKADSSAWYTKNRINIILHPETQLFVDSQLNYVEATLPPEGDPDFEVVDNESVKPEGVAVS